MPHGNARLRRLVVEDLGECCDSDVEDRIAELEWLATSTRAEALLAALDSTGATV